MALSCFYKLAFRGSISLLDIQCTYRNFESLYIWASIKPPVSLTVAHVGEILQDRLRLRDGYPKYGKQTWVACNYALGGNRLGENVFTDAA